APRHFLFWREAEVAFVAMAAALTLSYAVNKFTQAWGESLPFSSDLLLRHLPILDVNSLFSWSFALFAVWGAVAAVWRERERIPSLVSTAAALIGVRSLFILFTPLGRPAGMVDFNGDWLYRAVGHFLTFRHDLFFSGHVALPFLCFLTFRDKWVRYSFLGL